MADSKQFKMSISTVLLIICIIVLIIMGFMVYTFYNEKNNEAKKVAELQSQLSNVNTTLTDLQNNLNRMTSTIQSPNAGQTQSSETQTEQIQNMQTKVETKAISTSDLKGSYQTVVNGQTYILNLYENGTFKYKYDTPADIRMGQIGNYIINNNTIVLNYLFRTGSSAQLTSTSGQKVLQINSDNSITDNNPESTNSSSVTMSKTSSNEDEQSVNYLIDNYNIVNKVNR